VIAGPAAVGRGTGLRNGSFHTRIADEERAGWPPGVNESIISVGCHDPRQIRVGSAALSTAQTREEDPHRLEARQLKTLGRLKTPGRFMNAGQPGGRLSPAQADRAADEP
jgi:hypothetical protein